MNPLLIPLISLILGIWMADQIGLESTSWLWPLIGFSIALGVVFSKFSKAKLSVFVIAFGFVLIGGIRFGNYNTHFSSSKEKNTDTFFGKMLRELPSSDKFFKFEIKIESRKAHQKPAKLLMYLPKPLKKPVRLEKVVFSGKVSPIEKAKNPHQFDYRLFMKRKRIHNQIFVKRLGIVEEQNIWARFFRWKDDLTNKIAENYNREVLLFAESLLLADRSGMDRSDRENFSKAGIAHLFALSGLHVGIVFGFFWWLGVFFKNRKYRLLFSLLGIWVFAAFAGFLPSITRASFMLSLFVVSRLIYRPLSLNDTLIISAFFLLFLSPNWLWDVGFQLSYSAVFFIGLGNQLSQPLIRNKPIILRWLFNLGLVALAAQLGTLPLVVYYFHQVSVFSVLSNMVAVPLMFLMLPLLLLTILFSVLDWFPEFYIESMNHFIAEFYRTTSWVAEMQPEKFSQIHWSLVKVLLTYIFFCALFLFVKSKAKKFLLISFLSLVLFLGWSWIEKEKRRETHEWIVFSDRGNPLIGYHRSDFLQVFYSDSMRLESAKKYILKDFIIGEGVDSVRYQYLQSQNRIPLAQQLKLDSFLLNINSTDSVNPSYIINEKDNYVFEPNSNFIWDLDALGAKRISVAR